MNYLVPENPDKTYILDIEADALDATQIWCVVVQNLTSEEQLVFTDKEAFNGWRQDGFTFIGHNIVSFDVPTLNRLWKTDIPLLQCVDTLILSYLYNPALKDGHSLEAWGLRLRFAKGGFSDWSRYTEEMLSYCKNDVLLTVKVYKALTQKMLRVGYSELSVEIEHKIRIVIDEQQRNGFWFDAKRASDFSRYLRGKQSDLAEQIQALFPPRRTKIKEYQLRRVKDGSTTASYERHIQEYGPLNVEVFQKPYEGEFYNVYKDEPFNLGSPKQRVERLLEIGWVPTKFTKTKSEAYPEGFPKVDEDALVAFATESGRPEVRALAEWLVIQGRASMLDTWFNNLGSDSRIHGRIFTCGATTRRMTHTSPNTANIPSGSKAKYGHECRSFWGVEPDRGLVLVGYDAAGLETAGLCHYLNNSKATEVLLRPKPDDIHTANARRLSEALGWPVDREWGAKTSWYAWLYGAYPKKLGSIVGASKHGMSEEAAGEIVIDTFFRNVPGLKELINGIQNEWKTSGGRLRTIDGGSVICPSVGAALNYRIQSLGAILMKLASIILDEEGKRHNIPFKKVGDIHDEGQLEVLEEYAERLGKLAVWSIEEASRRLRLNVPVTGDFKIGTNWSQTH